MQGGAAERWLQSTKFEEEDTQRPDIRLETVAFPLYDFWGQIVGCTHDRLSLGLGVAKDSGNTEIS